MRSSTESTAPPGPDRRQASAKSATFSRRPPAVAATKCHIALIGIEKIVPRDQDLALLLNLLGRSGTAQEVTVYTEFINGPKSAAQPDGPEEMHVIFVDNGRTEVLASDCREILRCIRCGACLNVCPVYRQASGHAYRSVYPGPVGAVLSLIRQSVDSAELVKRTRADIVAHLEDYWVLEIDRNGSSRFGGTHMPSEKYRMLFLPGSEYCPRARESSAKIDVRVFSVVDIEASNESMSVITCASLLCTAADP